MLTVLKWLILGALFLFGAVFSYLVGGGMAGPHSTIAGSIGVLVFLFVVWISHAAKEW